MIKQLEYVKRLQAEWSDNAVSVTVYYRKEELPELKEWLKANYNEHLKSVSFLLHSEHGFLQAPYEEILKEEGGLIDYAVIGEGEITTCELVKAILDNKEDFDVMFQ